MKSRVCNLLLVALAHLSCAAHAQLPITVDDILIAQDRCRLGISSHYTNHMQDIGPRLGPHNEDVLSLDVNLRYGLAAKTEISAATGFVRFDARGEGLSPNAETMRAERYSESNSYWNNLSLGISHQFSPDTDTPALVGFASVVAAERASREDSNTIYGNRASLGIVTYRMNDPVLLSGVAALSYSGGRQVDGLQFELGGPRFDDVTVRQGYALRLEPQVAFVVNNDVTLTGGLKWQWRDKGQRDGQAFGINETSTAIALGMGYNLSQDVTLSFEGEFSITGDGGSSVSLEVIYRFDEEL